MSQTRLNSFFKNVPRPEPVASNSEQEPLPTSCSGNSTNNEAPMAAQTSGEQQNSQDKQPAFIVSPNQPSNYEFPKTKFGSISRSVQSSWFSEYPWLHYNESENLLYCYICHNQFHKDNLKSVANVEQAFVKKGFGNWKKAISRFQGHQTSQCHKAAVEREFVIPNTHSNIIDLTNENAKKLRIENRRCLAIIVESLQYLARQGIPVRGHDDDESNFIQLVKLRSKDVNVLEDWIKDRGQSYLSHEIQNELLSLMSTHVLRNLVNDIGDNFFSIICDEYADISNKEQLTFCLRWVDKDLNAYEDFLGFYQIPDIGANTITAAIEDALVRLSLSFDKCRGQCYDGASNMLGKKTGVAQRILENQPKAFPTHCHAHSLSLGVKDTVKSCAILSETINTSKEIVTLIKYSPKREAMLGVVQDNIEGEVDDEYRVPGMVKFCPTRWTVTAACYKRLLDNYASLLKVWEDCLDSNLQPDVRARIIGCQTQMRSFTFFFGLNLSQKLFAHTDNLSKALQSSGLSATSGQHLARLTVTSLQSMRNDESFKLMYDLIILKAQQHPSVGEPKLPRKRRAPSRYEIGSAESSHPSTPQDHFRRIYFESIDLLVTAIQERFNQPAFLIYQTLEDLLLKTVRGEDTLTEMKTVLSTFSTEVSETVLGAQLPTFKVLMSGNEDQMQCFKDILDKVKSLNEHTQSLIHEVVTLCKIMLVSPATSATAERSFSTARRLKTWLRSQMLQSRFNHLAILNIHKKRLDNLSLASVANDFISLNENRKRNFGVAKPEDFH